LTCFKNSFLLNMMDMRTMKNSLRYLFVGLTSATSFWVGPGIAQTQQFQQDKVVLQSQVAITGVRVNQELVRYNLLSERMVEVIIQGDESGLSCTNEYIVSFKQGPDARLLANHCHGEDRFDVQPGSNVEALEYHDGNEDVGFNELAQGPGPQPGPREKTVMDQFKWGFSEQPDPMLTLSVPETDDVAWVSVCLPETKRIKSYVLLVPEGIENGVSPELTYQVDDLDPVNYTLGAENFPFLEGGIVPALYTNSSHSLFYLMAKGLEIALDMNQQIQVTFSLRGSAKPIRAFLAACHSLEG
jgi:hypothetical protein